MSLTWLSRSNAFFLPLKPVIVISPGFSMVAVKAPVILAAKKTFVKEFGLTLLGSKPIFLFATPAEKCNTVAILSPPLLCWLRTTVIRLYHITLILSSINIYVAICLIAKSHPLRWLNALVVARWAWARLSSFRAWIALWRVGRVFLLRAL